MTVTSGAKTIRIDKSEAYLVPESALNLRDVPIVVADQDTPRGIDARQSGVRRESTWPRQFRSARAGHRR